MARVPRRRSENLAGVPRPLVFVPRLSRVRNCVQLVDNKADEADEAGTRQADEADEAWARHKQMSQMRQMRQALGRQIRQMRQAGGRHEAGMRQADDGASMRHADEADEADMR